MSDPVRARVSASRRALLAALATLVTLLLILGVSEGVLRLAGVRPWYSSTLDADEPVLHEPHSVLGWRNAEGRYRIPPYAPGGPEVVVTQLSDGRRATGPPANTAGDDGRRQLVLVGGSYTKGTAISDAETFGWKLRDAFPSLRVENYGTGGYGSFQSLLALERALADAPRGSVALYGFIDHHELRNVAPPAWQDLLSRFTRRRQVDIPYGSLDAAGRLLRHPPERYPAWPLRDRLALVAFAQRIYAEAGARGRDEQGRGVTEAVLRAMRDASRRRGADFAVAILVANPDAHAHYTSFLGREDIRFADCARKLSPELLVPGEGHPNGRLNSFWARCIGDSLGDILARGEDMGSDPRATRVPD